MRCVLAQRATQGLILTCVLLSAGGVACSRRPVADTSTTQDEFRVYAHLSTNRIHVGDILTLELQVQHPVDAEVRLPEITADSDILLLNDKQSKRSLDRNRAQSEFRFELTSFALGSHTLTTNPVIGTQADGTTLQASMPPLSFEVTSVLSETNTALRTPKEPAQWPRRFPRWLWVLPCIALAAALAGWLVGRYLAKPKAILRMQPPESPDEIACRALRALKAKGWIESENVEPFYVELSGIVRRYIEDRFGIRAPERTTEEFIREAAQSDALTSSQQDLVKSFLEQADLVKFARFRPGRLEMTAAFEAAERLVRETTPAPPRSEERAT